MTELRKTVDIKAVDEEARTATGAVLVPNELDHQHDFLRPDAVQNFHAEDPDTGVMHEAFPDDAAALERNEVIESAEEIGDETFPEGTWVATRRYEDDDLWQLVEDGVLQGFSIGGEISRAADHEELPADVRVPDDVDHEGGGTELLAGTVEEVSDVDIPAVPRARYKGRDLGKSLLDEVDGEEEFVELMVEQRGHDAGDARRLYQYLTETRSKGDDLTRREVLQKPIVLPNGAEFEDFDECVDELSEDMTEEEARVICGSGREQSKHDTMSDIDTDTDSGEPDAETKLQVIKSWLTGSDDGEDSSEAPDQKAEHDDEDDEDDEEDDEEGDDEMAADKNAPAGDTADADMTDDNTEKSDEPPAWAESLTEKVEQIDNRLDKVEGDDADDDAEKAIDDAPEWAQNLAAKVDDLDDRVDAISKQSGHSQQLDGTEKTGGEPDDDVEAFKAGLVGRSGGD